MLKWMRSSLPARAGFAVLLIAVLALASALSAGVIAWLSQDDAAAINTAGSLRMATYQLSWKLEAQAPREQIDSLVASFEQRLDSADLHKVLESDPQAPLQSAYLQLQSNWRNNLRPALASDDRRHFLDQADGFVEQLNHFVLLLQQKSERKQSWQQNIQGASLFITVLILLIGMYELQTNVITPLQYLMSAAERFRDGDHSARVEFQSEDELGQMALSFNAMADAIEESHRTLESRVAQKTATLNQANGALQLLFFSSRQLASHLTSAEQLDLLIDNFQALIPGLRLTLCLHGNPHKPAEQLIALHGSESRDELSANFLDGHPPQHWENELIQALADLVGTALSLERQREQDHRLLLLEERTIIARELHDSLAQALSYMKLQVSRLQTLMRRGENAEMLFSVSEEIREGINNAYRQLRELLTTFRLQIHGSGLDQALDDTVREFAERGAFEVLLQVEPLAFTLDASEQIHLLQIAREALSNCARHAQAKHVKVHLSQQGEHIELLIEDDGCGIGASPDPRQHHGLTIMQERTRSLNGQLDVSRNTPHGTRIHLSFQPGFLGRHAEESPA
ncbi:MAG: nitrate/nitrite two-component system sensor histidine kinase [Pseudomonas sp. PGPPP3]|nr:MAG: nitrate/nitrite two-component system sensor histidine kinase [Pseudomonas sp. PGPPP3]